MLPRPHRAAVSRGIEGMRYESAYEAAQRPQIPPQPPLLPFLCRCLRAKRQSVPPLHDSRGLSSPASCATRYDVSNVRFPSHALRCAVRAGRLHLVPCCAQALPCITWHDPRLPTLSFRRRRGGGRNAVAYMPTPDVGGRWPNAIVPRHRRGWEAFATTRLPLLPSPPPPSQPPSRRHRR